MEAACYADRELLMLRMRMWDDSDAEAEDNDCEAETHWGYDDAHDDAGGVEADEDETADADMRMMRSRRLRNTPQTQRLDIR